MRRQHFYFPVIYTDAQGSGIYKIIWLIRHSSKVIVLVILYALSNLLSYYALARVDASAYTVLLQVCDSLCVTLHQISLPSLYGYTIC